MFASSKYFDCPKLGGHKEAVWTTTQYQDKIISGSLDGMVKLWDPQTKTMVQTFQRPDTFVNTGGIYSQVLLSENELAVGFAKGIIAILDLKANVYPNIISDIEGHVYSLALFGDKHFIGQCGNGTIQVWEKHSAQKVHTITNVSEYVSTLLTNSQNIFCENIDSKIGIWDQNTMQLLQVLPGHTEGKEKMQRHMRTLSFLYGQHILLSGANNFEIKVWDLRVKENSVITFKEHTNFVNALAPISDNVFASASGDKTIKVWDIRSQNCTQTIHTNHSSWIQSLTVFTNKTFKALISGSGDCTMGVFAAQQNEGGQYNVIISKNQRNQGLPPNNFPQKETQYFYFKSKQQRLQCVINLLYCNTTNVQPFLEVIEVLELNKKMEIQVKITSTQMKVLFKGKLDEKSTLLFIKKLQDLGLVELHQNKNALWFYSNEDGLEILNELNYTNQIKEFLTTEKQVFNTYISNNKYITLIEVGCGIGENVDIALKNNMNYTGLDFAAGKIIKCRKKLQNIKSMNKLNAVCMNIIDFLEESNIYHQELKNAAIIFPFNVFGNIAPISQLLVKLKLQKVDFLLSVYKNTIQTVQMRQKYYENCGYKNIEVYEDKTGTTFRSNEGLYTVAYEKIYLQNLLQSLGFLVQVSETQYGLVFFVQHTQKTKVEILKSKVNTNKQTIQIEDVINVNIMQQHTDGLEKEVL